MPTVSIDCPAKVNLFLEIRGRRADGYHELGTLFQALEVCDVLHAAPADALTLEGAEGLTRAPEDNLVLRAARLLRERHGGRIAAGTAPGIRFTLDKRLPAGAGLGGGSADAAGALRLADALWGTRLSAAELAALGAELGSDVPFFLGAPSAYGEGRGELLGDAPPPPPFHVVVATPPCHVDTPGAYRRAAEWREARGGAFGARWPTFRTAHAGRHADKAFYRTLHNDFEAPVLDAWPEIAAVHAKIAGFKPVSVLLSGSGASVFGLFEDARDADAALAAVQPDCRFAVRTRFQTAMASVRPAETRA